MTFDLADYLDENGEMPDTTFPVSPAGEVNQTKPGNTIDNGGCMGIFQGSAISKGANGDTYEVPPADNHPAVLAAIIDLGTQRVPKFNAPGAFNDVHQVYLVWELPLAKVSGTNNSHVIGRSYTLSFHEKAGLRQMLESWRGKKYTDGETIDLALVLGKPCLLSVVHGTSKTSGNTFAKIDGVAKLPTGMPAPKGMYKPLLWEGSGTEPVTSIPAWVPFIFGEPVADVISRCLEMKPQPALPVRSNGQQQAPSSPVAVEEIPF